MMYSRIGTDNIKYINEDGIGIYGDTIIEYYLPQTFSKSSCFKMCCFILKNKSFSWIICLWVALFFDDFDIAFAQFEIAPFN